MTGAILALDLGTRTGYAMRLPNGQVVGGVARFETDRYSGGGMRYLRFRRWLDEMHLVSEMQEVAFEEVRRHAGTDAAHVYGGMLATLTAWCEEHGVPYQGVPVGTIKKAATGKGNAPKEAMLAAARALGYEPIDDNHADAICLLHSLS